MKTTSILVLAIFSIAVLLFSCSQTKPEAYLQEGDSYYRLGKYDKAIEQYDRAIKVQKKYSKAYINKGQALEFERKFQEAIENYNVILKISPDQSDVLIYRGTCYVRMNMYQEALADLEKANRQEPDNPLTLSSLGLCKVSLKDASGLNELDRSVLLDPSNDKTFYNRGLAKFLLLNFDNAAVDFEAAIVLNPNLAEAYFSLGMCKFHLGEHDAACQYWKEAVKKGYYRGQPAIDQNCNSTLNQVASINNFALASGRLASHLLK